MSTVDVSACVITFNREAMLRKAIASLLGQETEPGFAYEIVIVDNASTDATERTVQEVSREAKVPIRYVLETEKGIAPSRNRAVREAAGRWIAFMDDDEYASPDWLKSLYRVAVEKGADCVGGSVRLDLSSEQLLRLGPVCRSLIGEVPYSGEPTLESGKVTPSTGNILISRAAFDVIGYFETKMTLGGSDGDFVHRLRSGGLKSWTAPGAVTYHSVPQYRMEDDYLHWASTRWGCHYAFMDFQRLARTRLLAMCVARIAQACLVNLPLAILAAITRNQVGKTDRKCLVWRALGYSRQVLKLVAPKVFPQTEFFSKLEFRRERGSVGELSR